MRTSLYLYELTRHCAATAFGADDPNLHKIPWVENIAVCKDALFGQYMNEYSWSHYHGLKMKRKNINIDE